MLYPLSHCTDPCYFTHPNVCEGDNFMLNLSQTAKQQQQRNQEISQQERT